MNVPQSIYKKTHNTFFFLKFWSPLLNGLQKDMLWSSNINLKWKKFHKPLTGSQFCLFLLSVLQHTLCTPGFLRRQDGKLHAVQFLAPADSDLTLSNTDTMHTHTHTNITPNPWTKSVFSPVFSITAHLLHCYWLPYVGWSCINTVILLLRCSPTLFQ